MPEPINILIVVTAMETGGLEVYLVTLLRAMDRKRFRVTIVCTGRDSNWYRQELEALGVQTLYCPNPYTQLGYPRRIGRLLRDLNTHVVCDFRNDFAAPTMWAAMRLGIRSRIALYQSANVAFRPTLLRRAYANVMHRCTLRWTTRIVGVSRSVLDAFYPDRGDCDKFIVVYNGVDLSTFTPGCDGGDIRYELGIRDDAMVVGHVGRFHPAKNHQALLDAFAQVRRKLKRAHLLLVGDGALRGSIEAQLERLNLKDAVTLAGRRTNVASMLAAMDVCFFPSRREGHPVALVEAMACGLPVVASNIAPVVETMPQNCAKDLFEPDDANGMADRLIQYGLSAERRTEVGRMLRKHVVEKFSIERAAAALCRCWEQDLEAPTL